MRTPVPSAAGAALCLATLLPVPGRAADEAVLPDGRRRPGVLNFAQDRLVFQPAGDQAALPLAEVHAVHFPVEPVAPLMAGRVHRVLLPDGQRLTGALLGLDEQRLRLRAAWADDLAVPRSAVAAVTQLPGRDTFYADDFEPGLPGWKAAGAPHLGEQRSPAGQHCLILDRPGQAAEHALDDAPEAGAFAVDFQPTGAGVNGAVEAEFRGNGAARTVRVTVAGDDDTYGVEVPDLKGTGYPLTRAAGWHRLRIDFAPASLAITVDDRVLWHAEGRGPEGALRQIRLVCAAGRGTDGGSGAVAFADVSVSREVPEPRRPPGDLGQDEVWLRSGDQLFGRVPRADSRALAVRGRFGERELPWAEVRGLFLRRDGASPPGPDGERVRVWLQSGAGAERDELEGVVSGLDEQSLTLRQPLLGECKIDRARLRELRPAAK